MANAEYAQGIFDSDLFFTMRLAWLRNVIKGLQESFWNAYLAVKLKVGGSISEPKMDELRNGMCCDGIDKETGMARQAVLVRHPHRPDKDFVLVPTPIPSSNGSAQ